MTSTIVEPKTGELVEGKGVFAFQWSPKRGMVTLNQKFNVYAVKKPLGRNMSHNGAVRAIEESQDPEGRPVRNISYADISAAVHSGEFEARFGKEVLVIPPADVMIKLLKVKDQGAFKDIFDGNGICLTSTEDPLFSEMETVNTATGEEDTVYKSTPVDVVPLVLLELVQ